MERFILYFKNKEDILISVFQEKMAIFVENVKEIIERGYRSLLKNYSK